jgi:hypothetical protein
MAQVEGLRSLQAKLKAMRKRHYANIRRGLIKAGLFLQRESQKLVPIDTGALRNSAFTRPGGTEEDPEVRVGYTQSYAAYVHENLEAAHAPGRVAKFLERPAREKRDDIARIVREEARKP